MANPSLATEAAAAGDYPSRRFNQRERKLAASVKEYVDSISPDTVITTEGDIIVGNASGNATRLAKGASGTVLVAGASTLSYAQIANANVSASAAIAYSKLALTGGIVNADVNASAAIAYSKLALTNSIVAGDLTSDAVTTAKILDLNVTTGKLAADAVDNSKLADNAVSLENLDSGIAPSHRVIAAGTFTTAGGDASETITATGALGTDLAFLQLRTPGVSPVTIVAAAAGTDSIAVTMSGDPSTDHVICWQVLRAAS